MDFPVDLLRNSYAPIFLNDTKLICCSCRNPFFHFIKFQMRHVKALHLSRCKTGPKVTKEGLIQVQLSSDGVAECRSNAVSLDVFSVRFLGCKQVYPLTIIRAIDKKSVNELTYLRRILEDFERNGIQLMHYIADNPKRATSKVCLNHASLFPCEYCFAKGSRNVCQPKNVTVFRKKIEIKKQVINDKLKALQEKGDSANEIKTLKNIQKDILQEEKNGPKCSSHVVWPASSRDAESRTMTNVKDIIDKIELDSTLPKEDRKGVVGRSPLWDVKHFDFCRDAPTEYMHCACIGVVKRMLQLTFSVGESRTRITKRKLSSPSDFDTCMADTKVTRECSRRIRKLDLSVMKAQEMRNVILFFFPQILQCIETNAKERRLWLLLAFMIRSCIIPSSEFKMLDLNQIELASKEFYTLYEALFGMGQCTYNTHIVGSHLIEMRVHGPLTMTSAFGFEEFYGEIRNSFVPGTQSQVKQILEKTLLKRAISYHCCENSIFYSARDSPQECNSLIYCYESNVHVIYQIIKVEKDSLLCHKQGKYPVSFKETKDLNLNWSHVGVFKRGGLLKNPVNIPKKKVSGKVFLVGEYLITCPNNVLREK